jgi:DNA primase catalytic subunit
VPGIELWICSQELSPLDHREGRAVAKYEMHNNVSLLQAVRVCERDEAGDPAGGARKGRQRPASTAATLARREEQEEKLDQQIGVCVFLH